MIAQFYRINQVAGLSICLLPDGSVDFSYCLVTANGNQLQITQKIPTARSLEEVVRHLPGKTPVALNLSGKGVLYKQVEGTDTGGRDIFGEVLPNANRDDFYIQYFNSGASLFVSLVRRSEADKWIGRLREAGLVPLSLSLGPFPLEQVIPQLNLYGEELQFNGHVIRRDQDGAWISYHPDASALAPFPLKAGSEAISEKLVVPYASAFQLILADRLEPIQAEISPLQDSLRNKLRNQRLRVNSTLFLILLFVALVINFIMSSSLNSANRVLAERVGQLVQSNTDAHGLDEQIVRKEHLLQRLGWDGGISKSALVDQIAVLLPEEITLSELVVNPVDLNSSRLQRALVFSDRKIRIIGSCGRIVPVNEWIARIKTRSWVKQVQLESFAYSPESNTCRFTLTLDY